MISRIEERQKAQGESCRERPAKGVRNDFRKEVALGLHLHQCVASMGMGNSNRKEEWEQRFSCKKA